MKNLLKIARVMSQQNYSWLKFRDLSHGAWWSAHELMAFKTGEAITLLLLATLAIFGLVGIVSWYSFFSFSAWQWDLLLSCLALVTNGLLCSMQVVVIFRLGELKSDHINHFDMEKIMRRILIPEQSSQACISPPARTFFHHSSLSHLGLDK